MPLDYNILNNQKSVLDQQQLQQAFEAKKQAQQLQALGTVAALRQQANGGLDLKDILTMQMQRQNQQENLALRKDELTQKMDLAEETKNEKKDIKYRTDQNLLANALDANQQQINKVDSLFDKDGNLNPDVAANYGTTLLGYQLPVVHQSTADARALLNNVNATSFIQALGTMKSQSATGASGLGALSEKEGDKVQAAASAAADTKQSPESAKKNLLAYKKSLIDTNNRLQSGFSNIYQNPVAPINQSSLPPLADNIDSVLQPLNPVAPPPPLPNFQGFKYLGVKK